MKKSDIAMIILIASASAFIAYFVASSLLGGGLSQSSVKVKTIDKISSSVIEPDTEIFNSSAINPAVEVQISSPSQSAAE